MSEAALPASTSRLARPVPWRLLSDERLVRSAATGEQRAFAQIFRRYHQELYRYCRAILGSDEDARDALQETMVATMRALPGERRSIALRPWLYRIAHNEAITILRTRRHASMTAVDDADLPDEPSVQARTEQRQRLRELLADLAELPERQRSALVMRELGDLSHEEIGTSFGTSAAATRQLVYEARVGLQQISEGREMECDDVRKTLSANDRRLLRGRRIRAHLRSCQACADFDTAISQRRADLRALVPALPAAASASLLGELLGGGHAAAGTAAAGAIGAGGKAVATSTVAKIVAVVAASAAVGVGAADLSGLVHLHAPFSGNSSGGQSAVQGGEGRSPAGAAGPASASGVGVGAGAAARVARRHAAATRHRAAHGSAAGHRSHGKAKGHGHSNGHVAGGSGKALGHSKGPQGNAHGQSGSSHASSPSSSAPGQSGAPPPGQVKQQPSSSPPPAVSGPTSPSGSGGALTLPGNSGNAPAHSVKPRKGPGKRHKD